MKIICSRCGQPRNRQAKCPHCGYINEWRYPRTEIAAENEKLYRTAAWKRIRKLQLFEQPFCALCGDRAKVVHHVEPHNGNWILFTSKDNLQSLCNSCHSRLHATQDEDKETVQ